MSSLCDTKSNSDCKKEYKQIILDSDLTPFQALLAVKPQKSEATVLFMAGCLYSELSGSRREKVWPSLVSTYVECYPS